MNTCTTLEARAVELSRAGKSDPEVAAATGLSPKVVARLRRENGRYFGGPKAFYDARMGPRRRAVCELARQGIPQREIAAKLKLSIPAVGRTLNYLRRNGDLPRPREVEVADEVHIRRLLARDQIRLGTLRAVLSGLTQTQREWLARQIPPDAVMADAITAIIRDAYQEDMDAT
jgi:DNA-binding CsgD family transcriptional regulator